MRSRHVAIVFGASVGSLTLLVIVIGLLLWWRYRHNQQIFYDVNGKRLHITVLKLEHSHLYFIFVILNFFQPFIQYTVSFFCSIICSIYIN